MPVDIADPFPTEVVEMVLQYAATIDTPTCLAVCLTNKSLSKKIGQPALYRNIEILGTTLKRNNYKRKYNTGWKWSSICRTLLNNRNLAKLVRSLNVQLNEHEDYSIDSSLRQFQETEPLRDLLNNELSLTPAQREAVFNWYDHDLARWYDCECQELCNDDHMTTTLPVKGYLCLCMLACPNLTTLRLSGCFWTMKSVDSLTGALRDAAQSSTSTEPSTLGLQSLQEVILTSDCDGTTSTSFVHSLLFYWPGLRKLTVEVLYYELHDSDHIYCHSSLQELHMRWVLKEEGIADNLCMILQRCSQLRTLTLDFGDECDIYKTIEWTKIGVELCCDNTMLEELRIEASYRCLTRDLPSPSDDEDHYDDCLGSLEWLHCLRKLVVPALVLFGTSKKWILADVLPSSMEEVELLCRGMDFSATERALLDGTDDVKDITLFNCMRDRWISKRLGEGSKAPAPDDERVTALLESDQSESELSD